MGEEACLHVMVSMNVVLSVTMILNLNSNHQYPPVGDQNTLPPCMVGQQLSTQTIQNNTNIHYLLPTTIHITTTCNETINTSTHKTIHSIYYNSVAIQHIYNHTDANYCTKNET